MNNDYDLLATSEGIWQAKLRRVVRGRSANFSDNEQGSRPQRAGLSAARPLQGDLVSCPSPRPSRAYCGSSRAGAVRDRQTDRARRRRSYLLLFAAYLPLLPTPGKVNSRVTAQATKFYSQIESKTLLYSLYGTQNRTLINYDNQMPADIRDATIAVEDK